MLEPVLLFPQSSPESPAVDFVAFPSAGAGASGFRGWEDVLPPDWRFAVVCPPGREATYGAPFATDMADLADDIASALRSHRVAEPDVPLVLFGNCLGGLLALLVAHRLPVDALVVAACVPPSSLRLDSDGEPPDDAALRAQVADMFRAAGVHEAMSLDDELFEELVDLALPVLTADAELLTSFQTPETPVACDILALYGEGDALEQESWSAETTGAAPCTVVAGSHFFVQESPQRVFDEIQGFLKLAIAGER